MTDHEPIAIERWGRDHWSTLAYVETRVVDHHGYLDNRHMRGDGKTYPTRLADNEQAYDHDDWDCVRDMVAAGLLEGGRLKWHDFERRSRRDHRGRFVRVPNRLSYQSSRYRLTEYGLRVAGALRAHKARGGNWGTFHWQRVPA